MSLLPVHPLLLLDLAESELRAERLLVLLDGLLHLLELTQELGVAEQVLGHAGSGRGMLVKFEVHY